MKTNIALVLALTGVFLACGRPFCCAQVPSIITYQGRVQVGATDFTGTGQFKFALVSRGTNTATRATGKASVYNPGGFLVAINITSGGSGYTSAPGITITDPTGSGALATATVSGGAVVGITINATGSGYSASPTVTFEPPPPSLLAATYWSNDGTSTGGSEPSGAVTVTVSQGLFTVPLGDTNCANMSPIPWSVFTNAPLYLRIWFNDGAQGFCQLTPDQQVGSVGYAMVAERALHVEVDTASLANGAVTSSKLADGGVTQTKLGASGGATGQVLGTDGTNLVWQAWPDIFSTVLASDGSGSGLDADLLDGFESAAFSLAGHAHAEYAALAHLHAADQIASGVLNDARLAGNVARTNQVWLLGGNTGTAAGTHFLGTRDNQPVEFKVDGVRALRLEPNSWGAPNVIGGAPVNYVAPWAVGATIAGGGSTNYIGLGIVQSNTVLGSMGTIGGGGNNVCYGYDVVGGGSGNHCSGGIATISGGILNTNSGNYSAIAGGNRNLVLGGDSFAAGSYNRIDPCAGASIAGGRYNVIQTDASESCIAGGSYNVIQTNAQYASIPGGYAAKASRYGEMAYASGSFARVGDAQSSLYMLRQTTSNASAAEMYLDGSSALLMVPDGSTWAFDILVSARSSSGGDSAGYHMRGVIENVGGTTRIISPPVITVLGEDVAAWDATVRDHAGALSIRITGAAGTNIRWVARVQTAQVSW